MIVRLLQSFLFLYISFFFPGEKIGLRVNMEYIFSAEKEEILSISQQPNMLTARDGRTVDWIGLNRRSFVYRMRFE